MAEKKKGFLSKIEWVRPYYKELQNKLINRIGIMVVVAVVAAVVLAYLEETEWASRMLQAVILMIGAIIGSAMSIQMINTHDKKEKKGRKAK